MFVPVHFDKDRRLRFDFDSAKEIEALMNGDALGDIAQKLMRLSVTTLEKALYIGLKHDEPMLTQGLVTKRIKAYLANGGKLVDLSTAVVKALNDSGLFNSSDEEPEGNAQPEPAPTT